MPLKCFFCSTQFPGCSKTCGGISKTGTTEHPWATGGVIQGAIKDGTLRIDGCLVANNSEERDVRESDGDPLSRPIRVESWLMMKDSCLLLAKNDQLQHEHSLAAVHGLVETLLLPTCRSGRKSCTSRRRSCYYLISSKYAVHGNNMRYVCNFVVQ